MLRRLGYRDHLEAVSARLERIHPSEARFGDIAAAEGGLDLGLGVVLGAQIAVLRPEGRGLVDLLEARAAWRV